jgi:hypothetical protein
VALTAALPPDALAIAEDTFYAFDFDFPVYPRPSRWFPSACTNSSDRAVRPNEYFFTLVIKICTLIDVIVVGKQKVCVEFLSSSVCP